MSFMHDKQIRNYCFFLLTVLCICFMAEAGLSHHQAQYTKEMCIQHDEMLVSSLLAQGVSKEVIATAMVSKDISSEGEAFLAAIGISDETSYDQLTVVHGIMQKMRPFRMGFGVLLSMAIVLGTVFFFKKRERFYQKCESIIRHYIEGDDAVRLPQTSEGSVFQMLSAVDAMATMLQAKNQAERESRNFLKNTISDISHQLKTPLAALMMYQEIIAEEPENPIVVKSYSAKMDTALKRIEQLIQAMLKITRLDVGSIVFEKENYTIANVIAQAVNNLTTRAEKEEKTLVLDGDASMTLLCDLAWTSEAIGNIVKNALDHTDSGGTIHISWEGTPTMVRIRITDDGHGIDEEDIHHIFKRFYRSKKTLQTQGIGLGLPLAKAIVEGQGGMISVQSEVSQGTSFILSFLTEL